MEHLLEMINIKVPNNINNSSSNKESENPLADRGKGKPFSLGTFTSTYSTWVLDLGAPYHVSSSMDLFSFLKQCTSPPILLGDDTPV